MAQTASRSPRFSTASRLTPLLDSPATGVDAMNRFVVGTCPLFGSTKSAARCDKASLYFAHIASVNAKEVD